MIFVMASAIPKLIGDYMVYALVIVGIGVMMLLRQVVLGEIDVMNVAIKSAIYNGHSIKNLVAYKQALYIAAHALETLAKVAIVAMIFYAIW